EGQRVARAKGVAEQALDVVHVAEELRIEMPERRRGERGQDARMRVARTRAEQDARERRELRERRGCRHPATLHRGLSAPPRKNERSAKRYRPDRITRLEPLCRGRGTWRVTHILWRRCAS